MSRLVSPLDQVDEPVLDIVYVWLSLSGVVERSEQALLSGLKQEAGMDIPETSASGFSAAISDV